MLSGGAGGGLGRRRRALRARGPAGLYTSLFRGQPQVWRGASRSTPGGPSSPASRAPRTRSTCQRWRWEETGRAPCCPSSVTTSSPTRRQRAAALGRTRKRSIRRSTSAGQSRPPSPFFESPSLRQITDTPAEYRQVRGGGYSAGGGAEPLSSAVDCALRPAGGLRSAYCGYRLVVASAAPIPIKAPPAVRLKVRPCRPSQGAIRPARPASTSS